MNLQPKFTPYHAKLINLKIYGTYSSGRSVPMKNNWVDMTYKNEMERKKLGQVPQVPQTGISKYIPYALFAFLGLNILKTLGILKVGK